MGTNMEKWGNGVKIMGKVVGESCTWGKGCLVEQDILGEEEGEVLT